MPFIMNPTPPQPPPFVSHTPGSIRSTAERLVATLGEVWDRAALVSVNEATFENVIQPLVDEENQRLLESRVIYFLSSASPSKEVRVAAKDASTIVSQATIHQLTREDVFRVVSAASQRSEAQELSPESRLYVKRLLREFKMNGLGLDDPRARERLKKDNLRLVEVMKEYIMNLNADTSGLWLSLQELEGLPPNAMERMKEKEQDGKCWVSFKTPNRLAVLNNAKNAGVRRRYYTAWENRMKEANGPLLAEMLQLRHDTAKALGFSDFAESREADRMLSTADASRFLSDISSPLLELGRRELEQLASLKESDVVNLPEQLRDESSSSKSIFRWDVGYYKRMAKDGWSKLGGDRIAEYFSFKIVLQKLFQIFSLLFGLRFSVLSGTKMSIETWHPDVIAVATWDKAESGDEFLGYLFIDPYPREGKFGHVGHYGIHQVCLRHSSRSFFS
jgi:metallopeptidase MepB